MKSEKAAALNQLEDIDLDEALDDLSELIELKLEAERDKSEAKQDYLPEAVQATESDESAESEQRRFPDSYYALAERWGIAVNENTPKEAKRAEQVIMICRNLKATLRDKIQKGEPLKVLNLDPALVKLSTIEASQIFLLKRKLFVLDSQESFALISKRILSESYAKLFLFLSRKQLQPKLLCRPARSDEPAGLKCEIIVNLPD